MSNEDRGTSASQKKPWTKPELKIISAGSAEANLSDTVKDGATVSAKS